VISGGLFFICIFLILFSVIFNSPKTPVTDEKKSIAVNEKSIEEIFTQLDEQTPLDLVFNKEVERYVSLYSIDRKSELSTFISRSELYFPIIESYLDKYNLPLELKYVAVVESGLNPMAKSKSGAVGLWQFLYNTCDLLSLEVNSYVDERRNVFKSTDAACRYFQYLYRTFNDWNLVLAAYNGGPGEVRKAIERSGGETDYWKIRPYLSEQAANYVPVFTAYNYLFTNYSKFGINPDKAKYTFDNIDTVQVSGAISLKAVAKILDIKYDELEFLNPEFKEGIIPKNKPNYFLVLPKNKIASFIRHKEKIYNHKTIKTDYTKISKTAGETSGRTCVVHQVKEGDYFHKLALQYNCTVENIKAWNRLDSNELYPGQKIKIWLE
jgi:membrane-bound lytic murein transglycosylase D